MNKIKYLLIFASFLYLKPVTAQPNFSLSTDSVRCPIFKNTTEFVLTRPKSEGHEFLVIDSVLNTFIYVSINSNRLNFFSCGNVTRSKGETVYFLKSNQKYLEEYFRKLRKKTNNYWYRNYAFRLITSGTLSSVTVEYKSVGKANRIENMDEGKK